jgi:hypothetical protein
MKKPELVTLNLKILHWTAKAVLVRLGDEWGKIWLPLSQIEASGEFVKGEWQEITMPKWLADKLEGSYNG